MEQSNKSPFINAAGQNLLPDTVKEALKGLPYASQDGKYFDAKMQEKEKAMKLNQKQQRCWNALSGHSKWQAAFVAVCVANGRNWKRAIFAQFLTDANVSRVDNCHLPAIRAIRNSADERFFTAMN